jgi:hypothetical protein
MDLRTGTTIWELLDGCPPRAPLRHDEKCDVAISRRRNQRRHHRRPTWLAPDSTSSSWTAAIRCPAARWPARRCFSTSWISPWRRCGN